MDRLTEEEYGAWRSHPTTQKVRQYWRDARARLMEMWATGNAPDPRTQAYAQFLGDLEDLTFDKISELYETGEIEDEEEPQRDQSA